MAQEIFEVTYYVKRNAFEAPFRGDNYLKTISMVEHGVKLYSFVLFGLHEDGTMELRDELIDVPAADARELLDQILLQFSEISKEEFEKAEAEYFEREGELNISWLESSGHRKYYGIDFVTKEQKDVMDRVSRFLKKPKEI